MKLKFAPYSKSRLDASDCPWAFANIYIGRDFAIKGKDYINKKYLGLKYKLIKPERKNQINLVFGNVVHKVLEEIINAKSKDVVLGPIELTEIIDKHMKDDIIHGPVGFNYINVQKIAQRFLQTYDYDHKLLVGTEVELGLGIDGEPCDYDDPNCFLRAKIDVLEMDITKGIARITDHKSQLNITEAEDNFQLALYTDTMFKNYKALDKIVVRLGFCRYGAYRETEYFKEELLRIEAAVKAKVRAIEERTDFTLAKRCSYCDICSFRTTSCPLLEEEKHREIKTPLTNDDAKKMFEVLIGLEAKQAEIKKRLEDWCSVNSSAISVPVELDNNDAENMCSDILCIGFKESESIEYPMNKTIGLLERYKVNANPYLLTNKKELDRIIKTKIAARQLFPKDEKTQVLFKEELQEIQDKNIKVSFRRYKEKLNKSK